MSSSVGRNNASLTDAEIQGIIGIVNTSIDNETNKVTKKEIIKVIRGAVDVKAKELNVKSGGMDNTFLYIGIVVGVLFLMRK
jgi:hypothetical protein